MFVFSTVMLSSCRGPMSRGGEPFVAGGGAGALVEVEPGQWPRLEDDGERSDLLNAVRKSAGYYRALGNKRSFAFGNDVYSAKEMAESMDAFASLLASEEKDLNGALRREFRLYSSVGSDRQGTVVFSSYYEHSLKASLTKTDRFRFPLYGRPADLVEEVSGGERKVYRSGGGRRPYFTRKQIDENGALRGRNLEIAWADDPVEIFFLQVQGSGWLVLPDGKRVRVRYAANNGHPFKSVGGGLIDKGVIPKEKFSRKAMVDYLASHPDERQSHLNVNPRYVFFKIDRGPTQEWAYGSLGLPLTPGRSVALDPAVFPPGALAWMKTEGKYGVKRFVLSQDEGGAIKGPARVDFFAGGDEEAEQYAVGFWEKGRLYFLVKK
ncbi:MAG: MltA domain-containing protein [Elusimicrobia bacterium]|nr:MltA domain-containing protein [Elusimicrobiota bacterium]